jgi:hypothetical protein
LIGVLVVLAVVAVGGGIVLLAGDDDDGGASTLAGSSGGARSDQEFSPEEQAYIDALAEVNETANQGQLSGDESQCIGQAIVAALGLETLQAGTTPDEIRANPEREPADLGVEADQAQVDQLADATTRCVDITQLVVESMAQVLPDDALDCVEQNLDPDVAASFLAAEYVGSQEVRDAANAELDAALSPCGDLLGGLLGG